VKILLDENLDEGFVAGFSPHDVAHVVGLGWQGTKNGALLARVAEEKFVVFLTADKNMPHQQSMHGRPFCLIVLDIHPNVLENQLACIPQILGVLDDFDLGRVYVIPGPHPKRVR